ncbi:LysR substrate-binding domain-containing protein [Arhodomonas sp. KWT2]|uniref:LysR substrate-binding domain-containing protein n=1 Tax=unclassified Arhodomonas TaxID=2621637 RepID=UPI001F097295|nr:LysR substrate-binding domain-containing protein [Arhodomonas sp. KWT]
MELMVEESETIGGAVEDLRAFCAVADLGTVSAAAQRLGETKGGVSRRLSRLERRLGVALLARTPRAVSLTEEGRVFFARTREALGLLDDAAETARASRSVPDGHLRVTAPVDLGMDVLPPLVTGFRAAYPQITVELVLTDTALDLAANRIDLALRATPGALPDSGYRASTLLSFAIALYASPAYLDAHGVPDTPAALADHEWVVSRELTGAARLTLTDRRNRPVTVIVRPGVRTTDYASVHRIAAAGGGIAPLPEPVARRSLEEGHLVRVLPEWQCASGTLYAVSLRGSEAPARVRAFRAYLRQALAPARPRDH